MPVLGYDTAGASDGGSSGVRRGSVWTADAIGGVIQKFHVAIHSISGAPDSDWIKLGITNCDAGGDPTGESVVEQVELVAAVGDDINIEASGNYSIEANEKYYLPKIPKHSSIHIKFDAGGATAWYKTSTTYAVEILDPITTTTSASRSWSVWVDYQHPGVLGYDTVGSSSLGNATIVYGGSWPTDDVGGIIQAFHVAIAQVREGFEAVKIVCADCKQVDGDPSGEDVIEQIEIDPIIVSDDNEAAAVGSNNLEADTKYYIGILSKNALTKWKYDSGPGVTLWHDALAGVDYATWFPDPCRTYSSSGPYGWSIWIDYEVAEGAVLPILSGDAIHSAEDLIVR